MIPPPTPLLRPAAIAFAMITTLVLGSLRADPVPLLLFTFDQVQNDQVLSTGSSPMPLELKASAAHPAKVSQDAEGVTGKSGDLALDLRGPANVGGKIVGGVAQVRNPPLDGTKSFTLAGWIKCAAPPNGRFFDFSGEQSNFLASFSSGKISFQIDGRGWNSTDLPLSPTGTWVFFAVTYDSTSLQDNLVFYEAPAGGALAREALTVTNPVELAPNTGSVLTLGNWPTGERTLDGLLDNMAIYTSITDGSGALTADQIRAVFTSANATH